MEEYKFNDNWKVWYHSINDNSWDNSSYQNIIDIQNIYDYCIFKENISKNALQKCMFFIMRNNIFPTWEDINNKDGYCISYKIYNKTLIRDFYSILLELLNERITTKYTIVNGISISPKKEFNIIKIWLRENINLNLISQINSSFSKSRCILKKNN